MCYARALLAYEWDRMDRGRSPVASVFGFSLPRGTTAVIGVRAAVALVLCGSAVADP